MHIENLRFFYEVAQAKSISTVAKDSHISQSALSQQLLKLENNLNIKLFNRSNKGVTLTKEGEIVFNHCEVILSTYNKMIEELEHTNTKNNLITIDGLDIITSTIIPMAIGKVKRFFPKYILKIISSEFSYNNILNSISDINISYTQYHDSSTIITKELCNDRLVFISDISFKKDKLTLEDFLSTPFIMVNDKLNLKRLLTNSLRSNNNDISLLPILFSTNTYQSALIGIKENKALTAIPYSIYHNCYKTLGYKIIEVEKLYFPLTLYISYGEQLYKKEKHFIDKFTTILKGFLKF
ncbi:LysR family transcriptional regulator [Clostridium paraputrificum]|uniref:LysR family transcriptional regulator n=1 Tax=Clostridium TaxID=1485 RepID=UPI003D357EEF